MRQRARTRSIRFLVFVATIVIFGATTTTGCEPAVDTEDAEEAAVDAPQEPADTDDADDGDDRDVGEQEDDGEAGQANAPMTGPLDFSEVVTAVRPAVVNIYTRTTPPEPPAPEPDSPPGMVPEDRVAESLGSGFIFDKSGLVLTNDHVVDGASEIAVRLLDDRIFTATVLGSDPPTDVAVLQLEEVDEDLPTIELGDSDALDVGNWVIAIGNPFGLASTVTAGIASATGRQVMPPGGQLRFQDFIQTDASINPGSSGGPLVNTSSHVVGIAVAMTPDGRGLGFAIPINMVDEILSDLIEYGEVERSWLGVYVGEVPDRAREELDLPSNGGAVITRLVDEGPAEDAGVEPGDILLEIDGELVEDALHLSWLAATIGVGETVDVTIYRGDERMSLPLTLGLLPQE